MLFVDEIHRMSRPAEEMLYMAMEDFRVDVVIGKGPGATAIPLEIPPFTLVGATTRAGLLPGPLRDRFGFTAPPGVLRGRRARPDRAPLRRPARRRRSTDDGAAEIASRSRGTPRIANRLLRRVRDYAQVRADGIGHPRGRARAPWTSTRSTSSGSTGSTGRCSTRCAAASAAGPVGVSHARGRRGRGARDRRGGRRAVPGPLGLLARTPRGRVATPAAWAAPRARGTRDGAPFGGPSPVSAAEPGLFDTDE